MKRAGLEGNLFDGVFFSESLSPPGMPIVGHLSVKINRQNSNLSEVKKQMAARALTMGANSVVNFRYGQTSHKWWQLVFTFRWDSESWFGEGDAVALPVD